MVWAAPVSLSTLMTVSPFCSTTLLIEKSVEAGVLVEVVVEPPDVVVPVPVPVPVPVLVPVLVVAAASMVTLVE